MRDDLIFDSEIALRRKQVRNEVRALTGMLLVIVVGTAGFSFLEPQWNAWDAFFFTLITITTVGYGDYGLDTRGEVFAVVLLLLGIAVTTYAFSQTVQLAVTQGVSRRRKMLKHISRMEDHFIVCGVGRVGRAICERFAEAGTPIVVIDPDVERCAWAREHGHLTLEGCGTHDNVLLAAGIERCRGIAAATSSDNENLVITLTARSHNADCLIVCRCDTPEAQAKFHRAGADRVVAPSVNGGHIMANLLVRPNSTDLLANTGQDNFRMTEVHLPVGSNLAGRTLEKLQKQEPQLVVIALRRDGELPRLRPDTDTKLQEGDTLVLVAELDALARVTHQACAAA